MLNAGVVAGALFASVAGSLISELLSWFLIGGSAGNRRIQQNIARAEAKLAKLKADGSTRKVAGAEAALAEAQREATIAKSKSMFLVGFVLLAIVAALNSAFEAQPAVTRMPFEPFGLVRGVSHRGLLGDDYRECSALFLYILASMGLRPIVQKVLGTAPPRGKKPSGFTGPL